MKRNYDYFDEEEDMTGKTRLTFRVIKGKPNRNLQDFAMIIDKECPEVQYNGRTHIRVTTGTPAEFKAFRDFCRQYLGNFPAESPYVYIPKSVLVQQPKEHKKKKSLFKG